MFAKNWIILWVVPFSVLFLFCLSAPRMVSCELVGYWPMDEGVGSKVRDDSGKGGDGKIFGDSAKWVDGVAGKALEFTDGLARVDCDLNDSMHQPGPITCMFWMKPTQDLTAGMQSMKFVYLGDGPMFKTLDDGKIRTWLSVQGRRQGRI